MKRRQVFVNAGMSILQVIVMGGMQFLLYGFLVRTIGAGRIGVWALILSAASVTQVANLGLSGSVVKFVAKYAAHNDHQAVSRLLQTTLITISLSLGLFLLLLYPVAERILPYIVTAPSLPDALAILPIAMVCVWLMALLNTTIGGLEGYQRIDLRSGLWMASMLQYLLLCFLLVGRYGLMGLAYSNLIQYLTLFLVSFLFLRRYVALPLIPRQWDKCLFKEMFGYGASFQLMSIAQMLYDPITKALLSKFGGLTVVGFYEMASKMVFQFRSIVVTANRVLVPTVADLTETTPKVVKDVYMRSSRLAFFVTVPLFTLVIAMTPIVSVLWIGYYEPLFAVCVFLLSIGWSVSTLTSPAYIVYLGNGRLRWNALGQVSIGVLNAVLGWILGSLLGAIGVVVGWVAALGIGSLIVVVAYQIENDCSWGIWFSKENISLLISSGLSLGLSTLIYSILSVEHSLFAAMAIVLAISCLFILIPLWKHPVRPWFQSWVVQYVIHRSC